VGKSGAYSIYRPLVLGAAVAGRTDLGPAFHDYGIALGEAFQLRDDLIDAYGDADVAGKPTGHDLQQHKMTMLLVLAARKDPRIAAAVAAEEWDDAELRALLDECDVRADVERRIDALVATARAAVDGIDVPAAWCAELSAMALQVAYRDR
jgi:geranylgeranyl diphosphate synthase type I